MRIHENCPPTWLFKAIVQLKLYISIYLGADKD
jgi:hypothetical protein